MSVVAEPVDGLLPHGLKVLCRGAVSVIGGPSLMSGCVPLHVYLCLCACVPLRLCLCVCVCVRVCVQEAEGGALASFTGTMRYSSGLIADQKRTAAALVRVSKMMNKVRPAPLLLQGVISPSLSDTCDREQSRSAPVLLWPVNAPVYSHSTSRSPLGPLLHSCAGGSSCGGRRGSGSCCTSCSDDAVSYTVCTCLFLAGYWAHCAGTGHAA